MMNKKINKCMNEIKIVFEFHEITGFNKVNIFKKVYLRLKNEYDIDLNSRRKDDREALYTLFKSSEELAIFKNITIDTLAQFGYEIQIQKYEEIKRDKAIKYIKEQVKKLNKEEQINFYREMYSKLNIAGISLYARRSDNNKALLNFIEVKELETLKVIFLSLSNKYQLKQWL